MAVRILHCADFHLDSVFSYLPVEAQMQRRAELLETFTKCMYNAVHNSAEIVVISGDLFDSHFVSRDTCEQVRKVFERIKDKKVYISAGNHDFLSSSSPLVTMDFPKNVHVFSGEMECIEEREYDIYGISFTEPYTNGSLLENIIVKNPDKINILVMHGDFASDEYNLISKEMLAKSGFDYVALGHSHSFQEINAGNCCAVFSGIPEGRGFDETGEKGLVFAWVKKNGTAVEFIRMNKRTLHVCEVSAENADFPMEIVERIKNVVSDKNDLYKIVLTGETNLKINVQNLADEIDCFYIKIYDRTQPKTDYDSLSAEISLKGHFVKNVLDEIENGGDEEFLMSVLKKGIDVLDGR